MAEELKNNAAEAAPQESEATAQAAAPAEETQEAAPAAEPKARDSFYGRIREKFPDGKYDEDEDEVYRNANSYVDALEGDSKTLKDLTAKLNARLGADPEEAEVVLDWLDGTDIWTATARHKGADYQMPPQEGTPEYDSWKQAGDERRKELDDMKAKVDEYRASAEQSAADLKEFAKENGLSEEQTAEFENWLTQELLPKIYSGRLDKDFYKLIQNARNYDADVEGAREQGRVDGRNEKIEVEKKHLAGSGLPNASAGGNASAEVDAPETNKTVDWLDRMSKRRV